MSSRRRTRSQLKQDAIPGAEVEVETSEPIKKVKKNQPKSSSKKTNDNKDIKDKTTKASKGTKDRTTTNTTTDDDRPKYWLLKAEPESRVVDGHDVKFSIDDLKEMKVSPWDGVRNYEARNNMQSMKKGELAFFYHSNCKVPGIVGIMKIAKEAYEDYTAFDTKHPYYDPKSDKDKPRWFMVDVEYVEHLDRIIPLTELKSYADSDLSDLPLVKKGRLSVTPVGKKEWDFILSLSKKNVD